MNFIRFLGKKVPNYGDIIFLKNNFWDRLIAVIPYINIKISSTILGKKFLIKLPSIILNYYGIFIQKFYNKSYGKYRVIQTKPIFPLPLKKE